MTSKKKIIIILCGFALFVIAGTLFWSIKSECRNYLLLNRPDKHNELLSILMKASEKDHFLSRLEYRGILYFVEKENDKEVILFKNGFAEFVNGNIIGWSYHDAQIRIPAVPEKIIEDMRIRKATSTEIIAQLGMPSAMSSDKTGNLSFTYFFLRDERAKRADGKYNIELNIWFENYQLYNYGYSIIDDLSQKTISEFI